MNAKQAVRPLVAFLHVPKTGGSSLRLAFSALFGPEQTFGQEERQLPRPRRGEACPWDQPSFWDGVLCCMGHYDLRHSVVRSLPRERTIIASVMRDPVVRAVSYYDHVRSKPAHHLHAALSDLTILDAVRQPGPFRTRAVMAQFRFIFGTADAARAREAAEIRRYVLGRTGDLDPFVAAVAETAGIAPRAAPAPHANASAVRTPLALVAREQAGFEEAVAELAHLNRAEADFIAERLAVPYVSPAAQGLAERLAARGRRNGTT